MKRMAYIFFVTLIAGCSVFGQSEKLLVVTGSVADNLVNNGCEVHLIRGETSHVRSYDKREIVSEMYEFDFLISPEGGKHRIEIFCGGEFISSRDLVISRLKGETKVDLGYTVEIHT